MDVFLGHNYLKLHNPSIDWKDNSLTFDRCPDSCGYTPTLEHVNKDPDEDIELDQMLEPGNCIFFLDWNHYMNSHPQLKEYHVCQHAPAFPSYVQEFVDVFSEEEFDHLPKQ